MPRKTKQPLPSGRYQFRVRVKGYPEQSATFRTKTEGRAWVEKVKTEMRAGQFRAPSQLDVLITDVLDDYLATITPDKSPSALKRETSKVKILKEAFPYQTLATLLPKDIKRFIDERRKEGGRNGQGNKPATVNRDIVVLHQALDTYTRMRNLSYDLPTAQVRRVVKQTNQLKIMDARDRRLQGDEEVRLMEALRFNPIMREAVILLLETAMRREELCNARWEHIKGAVLFIPEHKTKGKTGEGRAVPLSGAAQAALKRLPRRLDGRILGLRPDSLTQAFSRACKRSGIEGLRVHDLRREATTRLLRDLPVAMVQAVTGHSDLRSLARYTSILAEEIAEKMRQVELKRGEGA